MMPVDGGAWRSFRFSTDDLPEVARVEAVRELHERAALPGKIEPLEPLPNCLIRVDITKHALPGLGVMSGTLAGIRQAARSRAGASGSEDDLLLAINLSGRSIAQQDDTELKLENGDAMLATRGSEGFTIIRPMPVRFMGLRVPRDTLAPLAGRLDEAPLQLIPRGNEALNLLVAYAGGLFTGEPLQTPQLRRVVVSHIRDLVSATVAAIGGSRAMPEGRPIAAARLRAIMADIAAYLGDCDLTAAAVAQRQRVTPRYVHKLFEQEGLVFSRFVLERRLARAPNAYRRALCATQHQLSRLWGRLRRSVLFQSRLPAVLRRDAVGDQAIGGTNRLALIIASCIPARDVADLKLSANTGCSRLMRPLPLSGFESRKGQPL
jgi:AraC-like DNA-binding protein